MRQRGFTVLEVMIVVAAIAALALLAAPFLAATLGRADASQSQSEAVSTLREAQASAMSGLNNARYGVHFAGTQIVMFQGAAYSPADPNNVARVLPSGISVVAVALSPGGACALPAGTGNCDVHFVDHKGMPTETGSVTLADEAGGTKTVSINAAGMIDPN
ncbi:MAG TPA: prepilin-type N-terminal cleavage/methylation domain-containing protein [Patescibacteria group bacterium]|nr:prepilin-type N-terminal cleavage/methylation domain-containing protein [Patescibacteria group bacterium]